MNKTLKVLMTSSLVASFALAGGVVNLYSQRHYDADKKLYAEFTKKTGIEVKVTKAKAGELISKLEKEGKNSPADLFIASDVANMYQAKSKGLLQSVDSKVLEEAVPANLQDKDNQWFAVTKRARVIVYVKDKVKPSELSTYEDLADPKWKGAIKVRSSSNTYNQSLLASIIANDGKEKATAWAKGVVANMAEAPKGNDRKQVVAIASGIGKLAIVNTYYIGKMLSDKKEKVMKESAEKVAIFFPNQKGRGTHINISGIGMTKAAKNKENAKKFMEFLVSKKAQEIFAEANYEYPVVKGAKPSKLVASWGEFKEDPLLVEKVGELNAEAVKIFDQVGWK